MTFHVPFEEAIVAAFVIWFVVVILWSFGKFLGELAWSVVMITYHHVYFRIWAWKARPRAVRRKG